MINKLNIVNKENMNKMYNISQIVTIVTNIKTH